MKKRKPKTSVYKVHEKRLDNLETTVYGHNGDGLKTTMVEVKTTVTNLHQYVMNTLPGYMKEKFETIQKTQNRIVTVLITVALLVIGGFITALYAVLTK